MNYRSHFHITCPKKWKERAEMLLETTNKRMLPDCHYAALAVHASAIVAQPNRLQSIRKCGR